jgi:type IX secretion system PorP/SprF family membrane protein
MKKLLYFFLFIHFSVVAQQLPHMSQWANHQYAINPAHTGIKTCLEFQSTMRGQWINLDGAPMTGWISVSAPLRAKRKQFLSARHGIGGMVNLDQIGPFKQISALLSYAGHFNFTQDNRLSLGLAFGASQLSFDQSIAKPLTPDPVINGSATALMPNATFGAWWNGKNYFIGMSLYQLIPQKWGTIGNNAQSSMHGMINAGIRYPLNDAFTFLPGMYVGFSKSAAIDLQLQALVDYNRSFTFGVGMRNSDAVIAFLGFKIEDKWRLMYSYDFVLSHLRPGTFHSHELTLSFSPCRAFSSDQQLCPLFQ